MLAFAFVFPLDRQIDRMTGGRPGGGGGCVTERGAGRRESEREDGREGKRNGPFGNSNEPRMAKR